jgi:hypothetical protein
MIRHGSYILEPVGPAAEYAREVSLFLREAGLNAEAPMAAAMATRFAAGRQRLVYAHAPMLLPQHFHAQWPRR